MPRIIKRLAGLKSERAFTVVEVLVASMVLIVGLVMSAQFFASAASRVMGSDIRTVLAQVANEELETIRGMPYEDVGTTDGPVENGTLVPDEDRVLQNMTVHVHREVVYVIDPSGTGAGADYRRVTIRVSAVGQGSVQPVEVVSNVAGGVSGGTLDVTVTDKRGNPVPNANIAITNTHLVPSVNMHSAAMKTNSLGRLIVPGLRPDSTTSYVVTASKTGCNTDYTDPAMVVVEGLPYGVVSLKIDQLATMVVKVVDYNGNPVAGLNVRVRGPKGYQVDIVSTVGGVSLSGIRFSDDLDPYLVRLISGQGYEAQEIKVELEPGSTREVVVTLPPPPTTTTASTTTTTLVGSTTTSSTTTTISTTTTLANSSLRVTVYRSGTSTPIKKATVTLSNGRSLKTNDSGWVFFDNLAAASYGITVSANNYGQYDGTANVSGATTLTVYLVHH
jgi:hypothetical protein